MRIVLVKPNKLEEAELIEYFQSLHYEVEIVYDLLGLTQMLDRKTVDIVFINASKVDDFSLINYINRYYSRVKVIVSMDNGFCAAIENVRSSTYRTVQKPYHLSELCESFQIPTTSRGSYE